MKTNDIDNGQDIIDSRDIIARIEELDSLDERDEDEAKELTILRKVADQGEGYGDWEYGEGLIRESYFETYAQELAEDIGAIGKDMQWPLSHIDWEAAAEELKMDYTEIDFDGITYYMRA
jgi:hypothetical protein